MDRRSFLVSAGSAFLLRKAGCTPKPPGPNVLVIYLDDMRADGLDYMPQTRARFDHEFTQARAHGGACTDTRVGLFTGTFTRNHPWSWWQTARDQDPSHTWGPWVHDAGYRTGMFGEYITTIDWTLGRVAGWDTWLTYYNNGHSQTGYQIDDGQVPIAPISPTTNNLHYMRDELIAFAQPSDAPWFASWNPQHPHTITSTGELFPLPEHLDKWLDLPSPVPVEEDITGKPAWVQALPPVSPDDELDIRRAQRQQAQVLSGVDDAIEAMFAALEASGQLTKTVVFLSSDQGVHYGEHRWGRALNVPAATQKGTAYDPVVRVPLLATGPGFAPGVTDVPVSQIDITKTVVKIAKATPNHTLNGLDLRTIAALPAQFANRKLLLQSINLFTVIPSHDTVVTGPNHMTYPSRKLIRLATNEVELYDLSSDPGEFTNLAADPARATERAALENMLNKLLSA